jgi:D-3-phosphoglycerate dehydrogenase
MARILITEPEYFDAEARRVLRTLGRVRAQRLGRRELLAAVSDVDILLVRIETRVDRALLRRARRLRIVGSATTGLQHIDLAGCAQRGIKVLSLHGAHTVPTAEHTMGLLLSLCRRIPWAFDSLKDGAWRRHRFMGRELAGKTLGIIGLGRIGSQVAGYARAFGMKVLYHDPYVASRLARRTPLERLLRTSDVVTVHAALTGETAGLLDQRRLGMMKRTALLINTARGRIVDQRALLRALGRGGIAGAAVDVFEKEPLGGRREPMVRLARRRENLIITPHLAATTSEAAHRAGLEIARRVKDEYRSRDRTKG